IRHADLNHRFHRVYRNREWFRRSRMALQKRIVGADQPGCHSMVLNLNRNDLSAFDGSWRCYWIIGVKGKCAVRTAQIRRTHAREGASLGVYRRKIRRNAEYGVGNPVLVEDLPESGTVPQLLCAARA